MGGSSTHQPIKLVALNGSPKKNGNTARVMRWVVEGAVRADAETVTWIDITDRHIEYCRGCYHCLRYHRCIILDDMDEIMSLLQEADGAISGGYTDVDADNYPKVRKRALNKGRGLVRDIQRPGRLSGSSLKYRWIGWLRRNFLKKLIVKHPEQFKGVLEDWKEWGWLKAGDSAGKGK